MNKFYLLFFFLFLSCISISPKEYVCGERPCVDKKEFNEYFQKNLTVEIITKENKKNNIIDLAKLNTNVSNKKIGKSTSKKDIKMKKKIEKEQLKIEKNIILEQRKKIKAEKKIRTKKDKQNARISSQDQEASKSNNIEQVKRIISNPPIKKNYNKKMNKNEINKTSDNNDNLKSICNQVEDCDIDKIAEMLIKKGKNKPFPNISSN